jgi:hypothetical protein
VRHHAMASPAGTSVRRPASTSSEPLPHPAEATARRGGPVDPLTTAHALLPGESRPRGDGLPDRRPATSGPSAHAALAAARRRGPVDPSNRPAGTSTASSKGDNS